MLALLLIFGSLSGGDVHAAKIEFCEHALTTATITTAHVRQMETFLVRSIYGWSLWGDRDWTDLAGPRAGEITAPFGVAVDFHTKGLHRAADAQTAELFSNIKRITSLNGDLDTLRREVREIAARPEIERVHAGVRAVLTNAQDVPQMMIALHRRLGLSTGPQQFEFTRLIQQFGFLNSTHSVVAMGAGLAATLLTTRYQASVGPLRGFDTLESLNHVGRQFLKSKNILISTNEFDYAAPDTFLPKGGHHVIAALDVMTTHLEHVASSSIPEVQIAERWRKYLAPSGLLIILNDFASEPPFTEAQARAAGFEVVRWGLNRDLSPTLINVIPYGADEPRAGQLRAFVLRNGPEQVVDSMPFTEREVTP